MQALRAAVGLIVALLVHFVLVAAAPSATGVIDPFLLLVVLLAFEGNVLVAVLMASLIGLTEDAVTNGLFGVYGLAATVVGYVTARAAQFLSLERPRFVALLFCLAAVLQQIVVLVLMVVLETEQELPGLAVMALRIVVSGIVGTVIVALMNRFTRQFRVWKQERQPRVRWDHRL